MWDLKWVLGLHFMYAVIAWLLETIRHGKINLLVYNGS